MTVTFKTFHSGVGDCIFLLLQSEEKQLFSIMVDCGAYEDAIQQFVKDKLNGEIDLLIVTHIDNDHIMGVSEMLSDRIKVKKGIIFNSYKRNGGKEETINLNEPQKARLRAIGRKIGIVVDDIINNPNATCSAKSAITDLSATILSNPKLKEIWEREYTTSGTQLDLNEWGTITFLSPTTTELDNLDSEFCHVLFDELNIDKAMGEWDKKEQLFEILLRYATLYETEPIEALMSATIEPEKEMAMDASDVVSLEDRLMKASEESVKTKQITPANQASLAFVWEKDGHRILIMGDANPDIVVKGLKTHYESIPTPVIFDAIKVSHHGSHYNTTNELIEQADSEHYFFTGGEEGKRPSEAAVGRIVTSPLPKGLKKRTLHFNFGTSLVEELKDNKDVKKRFGFSVETKKNEIKFKL